MDPGDGHAAGLQRDHKEDQVPLEPGQREHLDGEPIAGREALPVRLQERLPGQAPAPLGSRVDPVVVQDPLHRGPSDLVAEVRERPADPCVPPLGMLDRHPDHARGHVTSRHRPASTAAGAAVVCLGDQSPVPAGASAINCWRPVPNPPTCYSLGRHLSASVLSSTRPAQ